MIYLLTVQMTVGLSFSGSDCELAPLDALRSFPGKFTAYGTPMLGLMGLPTTEAGSMHYYWELHQAYDSTVLV